MNGKGDTYRPVDWDKWSENYDRIFRSAATSSAIESGRDPESYRKGYQVPPHRSGGCMDNLRETNGGKAE